MAGPGIRSVNGATSGERRVIKPGSGPAASSRTESAIADDAVLEQWENAAAVKFGLRGDGRLILPKFTGTPTNVSDGDFWIEENLGVLELHYLDSGTDTVIGSGTGGGGGSALNFELVPDTISLPKGYAVRSADVSGTVKSGLATAGAGSVSGGLYEPIGLLAEDVAVSPDPPTDGIRIVLPGQTIDLNSGQINTITGASELVPSRRYFLSNISGRWVLDPEGAGVEVVSPIGIALTKTKFLVELGMPIVL